MNSRWDSTASRDSSSSSTPTQDGTGRSTPPWESRIHRGRDRALTRTIRPVAGFANAIGSTPSASASTPATSPPHLARRPPNAMGVHPGRCSTGALATSVEIDRMNEPLRTSVCLTVELVSDASAQQDSRPVDDKPTRIATGLLLEARHQIGKGEVNSCFAPTGPQPGLGQPKIEVARTYPVQLVSDLASYSRCDADHDAGTEHHQP